MQEPTTLTRRELFERVWSEPVARVAERLEISGAGLRKACLRHDVPVPPRGHWARIRAGQKLKRPPLPNPEKGDAKVRIAGGERHGAKPEPPTRPDSPALAARRAHEADPKNRLEVRTGTPGRLHAWAREVQRRLRTSHDDGFGLRGARAGDGAIDASVSEKSSDRAVRIVDALARAIKTRKIELADIREAYHYAGTTIRDQRLMVDGVPIQLRLREKTTRFERSKEDRARDKRSPWSSSPRYAYRPTGTLELKVLGHEERYGDAERAFRDTKTQPLEDRLNDAIVALYEVAAEVKARRAARQERERRWREEQARAWELQRQREQEAARTQALLDLSERWTQAQRLRAFITAAEATGIAPGPNDAPQELEAWLTWARARAEALDPLANAPSTT